MKINYLNNFIEITEATDPGKPKYVAVVNDIFSFYADDEDEVKARAVKQIDCIEEYRRIKVIRALNS